MRWLLPVTGAFLLITGCGAAGDDAAVTDDPTIVESPKGSPAEPGSEPDTGPTERAPEGVPAVLAFTAPTIDGGTLDGATLAGRPVVFWFWSPH